MDKPTQEKDLIERYLMGLAKEEEVAELDSLLKENEELRQEFITASRFDAHIREQAWEQPAIEEEKTLSLQKTAFTWFNPGAAAGLIIGLFSASMLWAYVVPREGGITRTSLTIASQDFEDADMKLRPHLPRKANEWLGRLVSVEPREGLSPIQGTRVGQLSPVPGHRSEYTRYLVDLDDFPELPQGHEQSLEVRAFFSAPFTEQKPRFSVELAAFSEAPVDVRQAWIEQREFGDRVLQEVARNYLPKSDEQASWHEVTASLEIPEGTRSVVISLGIRALDPDKPVSDFYLDAIEVNLVDTYVPSS